MKTNYTIIIDSREQNPWHFADRRMESSTLETGDYSIKGFEGLLCIERKELSDFLNCCGTQRQRFKRELNRLRGYWAKAVIIEASMDDITSARYRSRISPKAVTGAIASWTVKYNISFILAGNRANAESFALSAMDNFYRHLSELAKVYQEAA